MLKLNLKKHQWLAILVVVFVVAWALWTFVWVPTSETPSLPIPPTE